MFNHVKIMLAYHKGDRSAGEADRLLRAQVQVARYHYYSMLVWINTKTWRPTFCVSTAHTSRYTKQLKCINLFRYVMIALLLCPFTALHHPCAENTLYELTILLALIKLYTISFLIGSGIILPY